MFFLNFFILTVDSTPGQNLYNSIQPYIGVTLIVVIAITSIGCIYYKRWKDLLFTIIIGMFLYAFLGDLKNIDMVGNIIYQKVITIGKDIEKNSNSSNSKTKPEIMDL